MNRKKQHWKGGNMLYPIPAVMVSCSRPDETPNIITVAWTGTICTNPPMVYISLRPERYSYGIIKDTGEFVINLTTEELARATDFCGVRSGRDVNKWEYLHLTPEKSSVVSAPGIRESPVNIECQVTEIKELGSHHMFIANVAAVNVLEELLDNKGGLRLDRAGLLNYSHGDYFASGKKLGSFGYTIRKKRRSH